MMQPEHTLVTKGSRHTAHPLDFYGCVLDRNDPRLFKKISKYLIKVKQPASIGGKHIENLDELDLPLNETVSVVDDHEENRCDLESFEEECETLDSYCAEVQNESEKTKGRLN